MVCDVHTDKASPVRTFHFEVETPPKQGHVAVREVETH